MYITIKKKNESYKPAQVQAGHFPASVPVREKPDAQSLTQRATFVQYLSNIDIVFCELISPKYDKQQLLISL